MTYEVISSDEPEQGPQAVVLGPSKGKTHNTSMNDS